MCVFVSHPADFTPVCTTELGIAANYLKEFEKRNAKVIALSVDGLNSHFEWTKDINETQNTTVNFPIISDENRVIAALYDILHPNEDKYFTIPAVLYIAPDQQIKTMQDFHESVGGHFNDM